MMTDSKWTPKGGDGAQLEDGNPLWDTDERSMTVAMDSFKRMVTAMQTDDTDTVHAAVYDLADALSDDDVSPFGLLACVGIVYNSIALRAMCGDPDPSGQPTGVLKANFIGIDRETGAIVDDMMEEFAIVAVNYAANWQWPELNQLMTNRLETEERQEDFLHALTACLLTMFIGVGGIDAVGWSDTDTT